MRSNEPVRFPISMLMQRLVSMTTLTCLLSFFIHFLSYGFTFFPDFLLGDFVCSEFLYELAQCFSAFLGGLHLIEGERWLFFDFAL